MMKVAMRTDVGYVREKNEDSACVDHERDLLIVADGVGGAPGGEVASGLAVAQITDFVMRNRENYQTPEELDQLLLLAVEHANEAITVSASRDAQLRDMATTVVVALCRPERVHLAHVGDSRAYFISGGKLSQLTTDHTVYAEVSPSLDVSGQILGRRSRPFLARYLGFQGPVYADLNSLDWKSGDYLLLCTDGLTNMVDEPVIESVVVNGGGQVDSTCELLVKLALQQGGRDNITVILARRD